MAPQKMKQKGRVQMKIKDIVRDYNLDKEAFEAFLQDQGIAVKFSLTGAYLEDSVDLVHLLDQFQNYLADQDEEFAEQLAQQKEREQGIANIVVTTGQGFDGYTITHYGGPVASDLAHSIARGVDGGRGDHALGDPAQSLVDVMEEGRILTLAHLKEQAYDLGCNAIINLKFDYVTLEPETVNTQGATSYLPYVFCVTALGTAVYAEEV